MRLSSRLRQLSRALQRGLHRPLDERLLFLHVPKCGGNSIRIALSEAYNWPLFNSRRRFFNVHPERTRRLAARAGRPVDELRDELLRYHLSDGRIRLATGHLHWPAGFREQFPDVSIVTVLRDPVSRFLSHYYGAREGRGPRASHTRLSLEAFLDGPQARRAGRTYLRYFGGDRDEPDALDQARRRLADVDVLGILEDLPAFAQAFRARLGAPLLIPHANAGALRRERADEELTEALDARIREIVEADQILYDFVGTEVARRAGAPRRMEYLGGP